MWIMTQNRNRILNTSGMEELYIGDPKEGSKDYAVMLHKKEDGKPFALGFYSDKGQAAKIIDQIFNKQSEYISCKGGPDLMTGGFQPGFVVVPPKTFKMPPYNSREETV